MARIEFALEMMVNKDLAEGMKNSLLGSEKEKAICLSLIEKVTSIDHAFLQRIGMGMAEGVKNQQAL
jgi:hypothetical protein